MTDLSAFNVTNFPCGSQNLQILAGLPAEASPSSNATAITEAESNSSNTSSVMQLLYPENSIDPAQKPQGGAEFYASPLDLAGAQNVSLEYSVFFSSDFAWVLGGKLPGLYGGHGGCSGGNPATDCFSTRLMWRPDGEGELYLYAPKDKQTDALCDDPQSVCDAAYGFSVGPLNTPGQQDGGFTLDVDGKRVIDRSDVFYRDSIPAPTSVLTFFGGHEKEYASPKNQLVWFDGFAMWINE
ncbi:hypothetical protein BT96DRAFT_958351 [Gymnopus androsaceus JB14]|uniref:Polysaccharide lyase 14 domain-containing protein n=1 Tax=Gymnopus androsaceus JB14 TaxID=1447944 RepID=A0A6A4HCF5_9AGAR|nr:hypothetical protein BT96DRAFT_958351 [Gymnopus androsaceus JB14]